MKMSLKTAFSIVLPACALMQTADARFNSFDPRSLAMGGVGVAVADPATAPIFNPALLSVAEQDDDFSLVLPMLGFRVADQEDFIDNADGTDDLVDDLDREISDFNARTAVNVPAGSTGPVVAATVAVNDRLVTLGDSPLAMDGGIGMVFSVPSKTFGFGAIASGSFAGAGQFEYNDSQVVADLTGDLSTLDTCYGGSNSSDPAVIACISTASFTYVDNNPASPTFGEVTFSSDDDIQSQTRVVGLAIGEIGVSVSREFNFFDTDVAIGLTPKSMSITVLDYTASAQEVDEGDDDLDDYTVDYEDFNLDVGAAIDFDNGIRAGLVIKNLIAQEYETRNPRETETQVLEIEPQLRVGLSYQNDFVTVATDLDLNENQTLAVFGGETRYAAIGAEINAWDFLQLRAGYRADLVNSGRDLLSAGIGLWLGFNIDLAVAVGENENEGGFAFQLGFRF